MSKRNEKKVVFITGAGSGFGYGTAEELHKLGYIVYATDKVESRLAPLTKQGIKTFKLDVTSDVEVANGVQRVIKAEGKIDLLYANAGYGIYGTIFDSEVDAVKAMYDVNVHGTHRTIKAVMPHMIKRNSGRIIITESIVSYMSSPFSGWYSSTKHALKALSTALAAELNDFKIDVVSIHPGAVKTRFDEVALDPKNYPTPTKEIANDVDGFNTYMVGMYKSCPGPKSTVNAMVKAGTKRNPKRRYNTTTDAKLFPKLISLFGAPFFGRFLLRTVQATYRKSQKRGK